MSFDSSGGMVGVFIVFLLSYNIKMSCSLAVMRSFLFIKIVNKIKDKSKKTKVNSNGSHFDS